MHGHQVPLKDLEANECRASMIKYESKFLNRSESHFGTILFLRDIDHHSRYIQKDNHPKNHESRESTNRIEAYRGKCFESSDEITMIACYFKIW